MSRTTGRAVRRRIEQLDLDRDAHEIARLSLVSRNGWEPLVYALFTVAFLQQVAVPTMARTLHRRGTGDIVRETIQRNDDTIVFFGQLLDHGPDSEVGRAWIDRLNEIHAHFPLRNDDSLYTLATLALGPHALTAALGRSPFSTTEREAQWRFWRAVAVRQHLERIPEHRGDLGEWAATYEHREHAPSPEGRAIARALVDAFGRRGLPPLLRRWDARIISALCSPELRRIHDLPEPGALVRACVSAGLRAYVRTLDHHRPSSDRSLAVRFGTDRHGERALADVGYR